ncbi:13170_t:CDS:2 [Dentiscutata erythropus]|uniref:13170_t:CDS:1 n=1 Tax=Dentiscutata erythropus TaxID=1348616 RepID=A0A9N9NQ22_9GLOM|nr:13170_t:CDS:2 [Dentiscutata erythropus]
MHYHIKKCLKEANLANISHDEPISSSIIDTENPPDWLKNEFSSRKWKMISDNSSYDIAIKEHYQWIRRQGDYKKYNNEINKGTWQIDTISMPLKYLSRSLREALLIM